MTNILSVKNVNKKYKDFSLKDISFELKQGYIMGFVGPNGAGKTTIIKLIMNLIKKDSGSIQIFGKDHIKNEKEIKDRIGFVYDENCFYEDFKLHEIRKIIAPFYSKWNDELFYKYIKQFDLPLDKKVKKLSKGMKMKFSIAMALSHDPDLIIMDEPTAGLDPVFRAQLLELLLELMQNENKSIFFSSHITSDLDKIADYITFIQDGEIIFSRSKDEIIETYAIVKGANDLLNADIKESFVNIDHNSFGFEALTVDIPSIQKKFGDSVIIERPSLQDIMVHINAARRKARNEQKHI